MNVDERAVTLKLVNALTRKRCKLIALYNERAARPVHPRVGAWRHQYNLGRMKTKIDLIELQRITLAKTLGVKFDENTNVAPYNESRGN